MVERVKKITEGTLVPISLVITIIGGVVWLTSIHSDASAAKDGIRDLKKAQSQYVETVIRIDERLSRIEGQLRRMDHDSRTVDDN